MMDLTAVEKKLEHERREYERAEKANNEPSEQQFPPGQHVDATVLIVYWLMELANTSNKSVNIRSKQLESNAEAQEQLNKEAARCQWVNVPTLQKDVHHFTDHHTVFNPIRMEFDKWVTYRNITTYPNAGVVDIQQVKNREIAGVRQTISEKLGLLQQGAQSDETKISTLTDSTMETMQMGADFIDILQSLTYKALMRQPPQ